MEGLIKFFNTVEPMWKSRLYLNDYDLFYVTPKRGGGADVLHLNTGSLILDWDMFTPQKKFPTLTRMAGAIARYHNVDNDNYAYYKSVIAVQLYNIPAVQDLGSKDFLNWKTEANSMLRGLFSKDTWMQSTDATMYANMFIQCLNKVIYSLIPVCLPAANESMCGQVYTGLEQGGFNQPLFKHANGEGFCVSVSAYVLYFKPTEEKIFSVSKEPVDTYKYVTYTGEEITYMHETFSRTLSTDVLRKKALEQFMDCILDMVPEHPVWDLITKYSE